MLQRLFGVAPAIVAEPTIKVSDLLTIDPNFIRSADQMAARAQDDLASAETLRLEAETKMTNAENRRLDAQRRADAVNSFRTALGEGKG